MTAFEDATYYLTLSELGQMSSDEVNSHLRSLLPTMTAAVNKAKQEEQPPPPPPQY